MVAFQECLKPLFRMAQHFGVTGQELHSAFSQSAVEFFAEQINQKEDRPASAARVALYAGLNSTEVVSRLDQRGLAKQSLARRSQLLSELLSAWHSEPGYSGVYDIGLDVPFDAEEDKPSFSALCRKIASDFEPRDLLEHLDAANCVEHLDGAFIRPLTRAYVLPPGNLSRIDRMGKVLVNFTESFARDITGDRSAHTAFSERTLVSDFPISENGAALFNEEARSRGTKFLTDLDSWLAAQASAVSDQHGSRYGCGLYVFEDVGSVGRSPIRLEDDPSMDEDDELSESGAGSQIYLDVLEQSTNYRRG